MGEQRKLATIQKIKSLSPIDGADKIILAEFESIGWRCIVNKNQFQVGDKAIYCEIDSVLPELPEYEFLRKRCYVDNGLVKGFRIRSMKLRGVLSQGICFPINILPRQIWVPEGIKINAGDFEKIGTDVTSLLNIVKYESPETVNINPRQNKPKTFWKKILWTTKEFLNKILPTESKKFPNWIPMTDELRIQNFPSSFTENKENKVFYITEKLDGSSATFAIKDKKFYVMSRTIIRKIERVSKFLGWVKRFQPNIKQIREQWVNNGVWEKVAYQFQIKERLMKLNKNIAIQGEIVGEGIQKNKYGFKGLHFFCFAAYDIDTKKYLPYQEWVNLTTDLCFPIVPVLDPSFVMAPEITPDDLVSMATGTSVKADVPREGLVFRLKEGEDGRKISFKAINNEFLLKFEE